MNGYLLIDKPAGWTSFDVVNRIRHMIQSSGLNTTQKKRFPVGHAGTLDPLATGLMIIVLGDYTKRAQELSKMDKSYTVEAILGQTSTTGDEEGQKQAVSDDQPSLEAVNAALEQFKGEIEQLPPQYSAVKINGKRAYELARAGKLAEVKPRLVKIYKLTEVKYDYPRLNFTVKVSSGTYIRSLVEDIGKALKTGAYTGSLRRLTIGDFSIETALPVNKLSPETLYQQLQVLD